ncbi:MAG: M48 family metallopeptidase [Planctomycetes bacterium]|nr:M48 family metallopeptidase [Planctomycetota bacterium]
MNESVDFPKVNFREAQKKNRRKTITLIAAFILFFLIVGFVFGGALFTPPVDTSTVQNISDAEDMALLAGGIVGVIIFGVIAIIWVLIGWFGGGKMTLAVSRARRVKTPNSDKEQLLFNVVQEMSVAAGLPMPSVHLIPDSALNAFACGRNPEVSAVAVTTGLIDTLSRDELQGVIGHEMGHIRNRDVMFTVLLMMLIGVLVMLCDLFLRFMFYGGSRRSSGSNKNGGQLIFIVIGIILAIIAPFLARIIFFSVSRQREYLADATAVELNRDNRGIINALAKMSSDKEVLEVANRATAPLYIVHPIKKFEKRAKSAFSTHPPIKDRIARLEAMA